MSLPYWVTKSGSLGKVNELDFYEVPLEVVEPTGATVTFKLQSGELPPGIQVIKTGKLQGVPVVLSPLAISESREYKFTIRATAARPAGAIVVDRSFSISVSNVTPPIITPDTEFLGATYDGKKFEKQLYAIEDNPAAKLTWEITGGALPPGLTMTEDGLISGYILLQPALYDSGLKGYDSADLTSKLPFDKFPYDYAGRARHKQYTFDVRVSDGVNYDNIRYSLLVIAKGLLTCDQDVKITSGFDPENISLTVDSSYVTVDTDERYVPVITTPPGDLPTIRQENNFAFQFQALDFEQDDIGWTISLVDGSGFDQNGSNVYPTDIVNQIIWFNNANEGVFNGNSGTTSFTVNTDPYFDAENDYAPTVTVTGAVAWWANTYMISLTEGSDFNIVSNSIDVDSTVANAIVASSGRIGANIRIVPEANPATVTGVGFDRSLYDQTESKLPPDLSINSETGWLYGVTAPQAELSKTYNFIINAYKKDFPTYISDSVAYNLTILGETYDQINWITPSPIGEMVNGSISEFKIEATSVLGKDIVYSLAPDTFQRLPQGLSLLSNGLISGRCSFRHFSLDNGDITFDKNTTNFDNLYTFTVRAETTDGTAIADKTFTIRVKNLYKNPYENLYLKAFPNQNQRELFDSIVTNEDIFPSELLYRKEDPWFGRAKDIRFLEVAGVTASSLEEYINAIQNNHHWKKINFGEVKTAIATDEFYNTKYEVVYVEALDPANPTNQNVRELVDLTNTINPYIENNNEYSLLYPNSLENMEYRITQNVGYTARGLLPDWMTSVQPDKTVLGFTRAVVLAYTVPGASKLIAYRLKNNGIQFNLIDFVADRYNVDKNLSQYFDTEVDEFITGSETTFDHLVVGVGSLDGATVDYALSQPFETVNGRTVNAINEAGGLDGVTGYKSGDLLVFAQQENYFGDVGPNDGWNDYRDAWLGNDLTDDNTEGYYDIDRYDDFTVIPGYREKQQNIVNTLLLGTATAGTDILYIPYTIGEDFIGKSVTAFNGILPNTYVVNQELSTLGDSTVTKLTINYATTVDITAGSTVTFKSAFQSSSISSGYTITTGSMPVTLRVGCQLTGTGIPADTLVTEINGNIITVNNLLGSAVPAGTIISYALTNQRGGVWRIVINDNIVTLEFVQEIETGQKIKVLDGRTYGFSFLVYNPVLDPGQTVPSYSRWTSATTDTGNYTIFDGNGTRFFDKRDTYTEPGVGDKYIKFPQIGVFT